MELKDLQLKAVAAAQEFWKQDIIDPSHRDKSEQAERSRKFIDSIIRTKAGLNWTWEHDYKGDSDFEWCGAFVAACYAKVGLKLSIREKDFASTYRLDRYAQQLDVKKNIEQTMFDGKFRGYSKCESQDAICNFGPRAGDILLVGEKGYGTHITILNSVNQRCSEFYTLEGNGFGMSPTNRRVEGVIERARSARDIRRIIRPCLDDFDLSPVKG